MSEEQKGDADGDKGMHHLTQSTLLSHIYIRQTIAPPNIRVSCHIYSQIDRKLVLLIQAGSLSFNFCTDHFVIFLVFALK